MIFESKGKRVAIFPGASQVPPDLLAMLKTCEIVFFDGTFWSDDELIRLQGSGKTARKTAGQEGRGKEERQKVSVIKSEMIPSRN